MDVLGTISVVADCSGIWVRVEGRKLVRVGRRGVMDMNVLVDV